MRKSSGIVLLAIAFAVSAPSAPAQSSNDASKTQTSKSSSASENATRPSDKAQKKAGGDCSPQRAGVRCSRPKPRKPWFFGD